MTGSQDPAAVLRSELGADCAPLAELTDRECAQLLDQVRDARAAQARALDEALNEVLRHLPRLTRGPARKILFG
jgi:flagellar motility protein MotE (MotC chaperone)